uniref:Uncharacterized protein n=1 Tax=Alexandrium catenella TaxID=2925 RepID=A0A7S1MBY9_ALECA
MARRWSALGGLWRGRIHGSLGEACWTVEVHLTFSSDRCVRGCGTLTSAFFSGRQKQCAVDGRIEGFVGAEERHGSSLREEALRARLRVEPYWFCNLELSLGGSGSAPRLRGESLCFCSGEELPAASWAVDLAVVQARNALRTYVSSMRALMHDARVQVKLSCEDRASVLALIGTPDDDNGTIVQWLQSAGGDASKEAYCNKLLECQKRLRPLVDELSLCCEDWQGVVEEHLDEDQYEVTRVWVRGDDPADRSGVPVHGNAFVDQNGEEFEAESGTWELSHASHESC